VFPETWVQTCIVHYADTPVMPTRLRKPLRVVGSLVGLSA
jgi:hypothetical protein